MIRRQLKSTADRPLCWQSIKKECPPEGVPVWLWEPGRGSWIGAYEYCGDDPGGWFFGDCGHSIWFDYTMQEWNTADNEWDDDYKPLYWMWLPLPPDWKEKEEAPR